MNESDLLARIYARSAGLSRFAQVVAGPGHDCAVVDAGADGGGSRLLLKVDQVVMGRHVRPGTPVDLIGRKAVARAVSDIAAAGGRPLAALAGAVVPSAFDADGLFDAVFQWAAHWGCPLVGGDISGGSEMAVSIAVVGLPHATRGPVLRSGARPGDEVWVTGRLGGSYDAATGLGRHLTFEPRLAEAAWLCDALGEGLRAMMDLSDGLGRDAARLARASGVRVRVEAGTLPSHEGVDWRRAMRDGEDYELLFVVGAGASERWRRTAEAAGGRTPTGVPLTRIGRMEAGQGACVVEFDGRDEDASEWGWEHGE
ncbi:MAG: thiamine-phosphate kinase [Phycisphaerae bacterium]|nr:thiamine-phosphate kinase [Phycisphaerae bacterium]